MNWIIAFEVEPNEPVTDDTIDTLFYVLEPWGVAAVSTSADDPYWWATQVTVPAPDFDRALAFVPVILEAVAAECPGMVTAVEVADQVTAEAHEAARAFPELVGSAEVAGLLGVTKQRVHQLVQRGEANVPPVPAPVAVLAGGAVWRRNDWLLFLEAWPRRSGRPRKSDAVAV